MYRPTLKEHSGATQPAAQVHVRFGSGSGSASRQMLLGYRCTRWNRASVSGSARAELARPDLLVRPVLPQGLGPARQDGHGRALCTCRERAESGQTLALRARRSRPAQSTVCLGWLCFPADVIVLASAGTCALRVLPRCRGAARRTRRPGRARHRLPLVRFAPLLAEAARSCRHAVGDRWQVDETHVKVAGRLCSVDRAIDQSGQVVGVRASRYKGRSLSWIGPSAQARAPQSRVVTDRAAAYPTVLEELLPVVWHAASGTPTTGSRRITAC